MKTLAYTSELIAFDPINKTIEVNLFLQKASSNLKYSITPLYNLSQVDENNNHLNVVFCHLKCGHNEVLFGEESFKITIETDKLIKIRDSYDYRKTTCLLLIFHEEVESISIKDVEPFHYNVLTFYKNALLGNFSILGLINESLLQIPRVLGVSLLKQS